MEKNTCIDQLLDRMEAGKKLIAFPGVSTGDCLPALRMVGEKGNDMDNSEKIKLAALLIELDLSEIRAEERIASGDRDFEKLKKITGIQGAIQIILEYLEK